MSWRRLGGLLLLFCPQLGCFSTPWLVSELPALAEPEEPPSPPSAELPPHKAAQACLRTAQLLEKNDHLVDAIREYERARQYNPRLKQVGHRLAVLYQRQGDYTRAADEFQQALASSPKDADLLNDMGYFCYERDEWTEAEKWLRQALAVNPKHPRAWVNLGMTLGQQGRPDDSFAAFCKVLPAAQAYSNVGLLLAQQGKTDEARETLRKALALDPDLKPARVALERLENPAPASLPEVQPAQGRRLLSGS